MPRAQLPDESRLNRLFDELNARWWDGRLPKVPVRWSSRLRAAAGKIWVSRMNGLEIVLSRAYHEHFPDEVKDTLKHEMVHLYLRTCGSAKADGRSHGPAFRAEAERVKAPIRAKPYPGAHRPYRYEWRCPSCGRTFRSRVRGTWACGYCCNRYNHGKYSDSFRLRLVRTLDAAEGS